MAPTELVVAVCGAKSRFSLKDLSYRDTKDHYHLLYGKLLRGRSLQTCRYQRARLELYRYAKIVA
jgi:hypothetical protein